MLSRVSGDLAAAVAAAYDEAVAAVLVEAAHETAAVAHETAAAAQDKAVAAVLVAAAHKTAAGMAEAAAAAAHKTAWAAAASAAAAHKTAVTKAAAATAAEKEREEMWELSPRPFSPEYLDPEVRSLRSPGSVLRASVASVKGTFARAGHICTRRSHAIVRCARKGGAHSRCTMLGLMCIVGHPFLVRVPQCTCCHTHAHSGFVTSSSVVHNQKSCMDLRDC